MYRKNNFNTYILTGLLLLTLMVAGFADVPRTMYVFNASAETISKINLETNAITRDLFPTGQVPNQIVIHNEMMYVVNSTTADIQVINPRQDTQVERTITLEPGDNPWFMAFTGATKAYVTNWNDNSVSVVDVAAGNILKRIPVGERPQGLMVVGNQAFVANTGYVGLGEPFGQASVSIIDTRTDSVTHTLDVPVNAQDFSVDPYGRIHVLCSGDYADQTGQIAVLDLYTGPYWDTPAVVDTIEIGSNPGDLVITNDGKGYCVAWGNGIKGFLLEYDALAGTVLHSADNPIPVGPNVSRLLYDRLENVLWIPYMREWGGDGFIQKFDLATGEISWVSGVVGNGTQGLAILEPLADTDPGADGVASFSPGTGAGLGQSYFPYNVLGNPDPNPAISAYNASSIPQEILSLGHGGEIVLEFTDNYIHNGAGVDFTVFENVFLMMGTNEPFIEAAIVSVSQDGENFVTFPYDTATYAGLAGVSPTTDTQHPTDPAVSGGDSFDLADLGLDWVKFVKLTDLGDIKKEGEWNGDFDLDAVVAVNSREGEPSRVTNHITQPLDFTLNQNYPNPFNPTTTIEFSLAKTANVKINIYNLQGQRIRTLVQQKYSAGQFSVQWDGRNDQGKAVASGIYLYKMETNAFSTARTMILLK